MYSPHHQTPLPNTLTYPHPGGFDVQEKGLGLSKLTVKKDEVLERLLVTEASEMSEVGFAAVLNAIPSWHMSASFPA